MIVALLLGCVQLDALIHRPVHCSVVGPATCDGRTGWDAICTPCEEPYDWGLDYTWIPGTLAEGESIRVPTEVIDVGQVAADGVGFLDAYWLPAHGEHPKNASVTVVYSHGNYVGLEHYLGRVRMLHEAGFNVLAWDYRGYGKSLPDTPPDAETWWSDARAVRDLADDLAPDPGKVLIYGYSLGALPAVEQDLARPGCALFLEAPFTGIGAITRSSAGLALPGGMLTSGAYENTEKIAGVESPLFAMVGDRDNLFPADDVRQLVADAATPAVLKETWVLPGVDHGISDGGVPEAGWAEYASRLDAFLDSTGACR